MIIFNKQIFLFILFFLFQVFVEVAIEQFYRSFKYNQKLKSDEPLLKKDKHIIYLKKGLKNLRESFSVSLIYF